jgi:hypothetical protein
MANYLLSVMYPEGSTQPPADELAVIGENVAALHEEMVAAGVWVFGGGLAPAGSATVVQARGDDKLITDGPFAEGKELLGGICVIDVPDLDAALLWAEKQSRATTVPSEVRPFLG